MVLKRHFNYEVVVCFIDNKCHAMYVLTGLFHFLHNILMRAVGVIGKTNCAVVYRVKERWLWRHLIYTPQIVVGNLINL
jgi:hypothetical protein